METYKAEFVIDYTHSWHSGDDLAFKTREAAEDYAKKTKDCSTVIVDWRVKQVSNGLVLSSYSGDTVGEWDIVSY